MPTETQVQEAIKRAVWLVEHLDRYVNGGLNFSVTAAEEKFSQHMADVEVQVGDNNFDTNAEINSALRAIRSGLATQLRRGRDVLRPLWREYGRVKGYPETGIRAILGRLRDDLHTAGATVKSRGMTYGSISPLTANTGNGTINRLTVDQNGYTIENTWDELVTAKVIQDEHSGASEHGELFQFEGAALGRDPLELSGSGGLTTITCLSGVTSLEFISNPSFSDNDVGALGVGDEIIGWQIEVGTTATTFTIDDAVSGQVYRGFDGDTEPRSILFETNAKISQNFNVRRVQLRPLVPMYLQVAWRAGTATTGTITLHLGSQTGTATITTASSGWNILRLPIGTKNWFRNFNQEDPKIAIELTGANGTVWFDDVVFGPYREFNNVWYAPVGGSTPFLLDDEFSMTHSVPTKIGNTAGSQGLIQHFLWRYHNVMFPHSSSPTILDPT